MLEFAVLDGEQTNWRQNIGYARPYTCPGIPQTITQRGGGDDVGKRRGRLRQTCHSLWRQVVNNHEICHNQPYVEDGNPNGQDVGRVNEHRS